jgi:hypothetical protein
MHLALIAPPPMPLASSPHPHSPCGCADERPRESQPVPAETSPRVHFPPLVRRVVEKRGAHWARAAGHTGRRPRERRRGGHATPLPKGVPLAAWPTWGVRVRGGRGLPCAALPAGAGHGGCRGEWQARQLRASRSTDGLVWFGSVGQRRQQACRGLAMEAPTGRLATLPVAFVGARGELASSLPLSVTRNSCVGSCALRGLRGVCECVARHGAIALRSDILSRCFHVSMISPLQQVSSNESHVSISNIMSSA